MVSKVGSAFSGKWLLRGRMAVLLGNEGHSSHTCHSEHSGYALNFPGSAFGDAGILGQTALEFEPSGKAAEESRQLYKYVSRLLDK